MPVAGSCCAVPKDVECVAAQMLEKGSPGSTFLLPFESPKERLAKGGWNTHTPVGTLLPLRSVNMAEGWMIDQCGQEGSV